MCKISSYLKVEYLLNKSHGKTVVLLKVYALASLIQWGVQGLD